MMASTKSPSSIILACVGVLCVPVFGSNDKYELPRNPQSAFFAPA